MTGVIHTYIHTRVIHAYIHTHMSHTYIHAYIHTGVIHTYIHTCMHACIHTFIHTYIHTYIHTFMHTVHAFGGYIYPISRGLRWSLQALRWLHDGHRQSYIVLSSLMLSHDHRTMVAAYRAISRDRSQIVAEYRTMVVRLSCNNRRLAYDLDSKMLRSLKTCRKAIVVCDCSYDCGKNHCDCPR